MAESRVVYDDFSRGEYGHTGGSHAPSGSFTGRNVMVYRNGHIGPRPGLKALPGAPGGTIQAMWWALGAIGIDLFWTLASSGAIEKYNMSSGAVTSSGSLGYAPSSQPQSVYAGLGVFYLTSRGGSTVKVDLSTGSAATVAAVAGGTDIAIVGERLYVANDGTEYFRVWYSDAADFSTFQTASYFDVGRKAGISALIAQKDHLSIALQDGSWHIYQGAGDAASLRKATPGAFQPWVLNPNAIEVMGDDDIVFMGPNGDWLIRFDGSGYVEDFGIGILGDTLPYTSEAGVKVLAGRRAGECVVLRPSDQRILSRREGAWSVFDIGTPFTVAAASSNQGLYALTNGSSLYSLDLRVDRPGFTSDNFARPGDLTDTPLAANFHMPEWWSEPGYEVVVDQVVVDFVKWNIGTTNHNHFNLDLDVFGRFSAPGTASPAAQSWDEATSLASTVGVKDRAVFLIGEQGAGAGFQVGLTGMVGVSIRSISVRVTTRPSSPR